MNLGIVLAIISIAILAGPIVVALVMYQDNLLALVMPDIETLEDKIEDYFPTIEYIDFELVGPGLSLRVNLNVTNNSDNALTINKLEFSAYCSQHEDVFLGYGQGASLPLTIPGKTSEILRLEVEITEQGATAIEMRHKGDLNFHAILKDLLFVVQGLEVQLGEEIVIGPIGLPS